MDVPIRASASVRRCSLHNQLASVDVALSHNAVLDVMSTALSQTDLIRYVVGWLARQKKIGEDIVKRGAWLVGGRGQGILLDVKQGTVGSLVVRAAKWYASSRLRSVSVG